MQEELERIYDSIKEEIQNLNKNVPVIVYTGVGTFAGLKNENGILEPQNYHQFPPFLQELCRVIPKLQLYSVLIDPIQENPPYLTRDFPLTNSAPDTYRNNQMTVYVWRQRVYTQPHAPIEDAVDITQVLHELNTFAVQESVSTLYHNFTGVRNHMLAEYFDPQLQSELDHIIYGLSMRRDHGCYFDLAELSSYLPYRVQDGGNGQARTQVQFYNYYKYLVNWNFSMADREKTLFPIYMQAAIEAQKDEIVEEQKQHLKINILSTLRQVYQRKHETHDGVAEPLHPYLNLDYLPMAIKERVQSYTLRTDYTGLYDFLLCYFGEYLNVLSQLLQPRDDLDGGHELLEQITADPNPYKWAI